MLTRIPLIHSVGEFLNEHIWEHVVGLLTKSGPEIFVFTITTLFLTMILSAVLIPFMYRSKPKTALEWGFFIREIAIVLVLARAFSVITFRLGSPQFMGFFAYLVLLVGVLIIGISMWREHTMTDQEVEAELKKRWQTKREENTNG